MSPGFSVITISDVVDDSPLVSLASTQSAFELEALVDDNFIGSEMSLATHWTVLSAPVTIINIVPSSAGVVQTMDHVSLVDVRKVLLLQDLNVQVLGSLQLRLQVSLAALPHVDVGHSVPGGQGLLLLTLFTLHVSPG